jgi:hypothetical protein
MPDCQARRGRFGELADPVIALVGLGRSTLRAGGCFFAAGDGSALALGVFGSAAIALLPSQRMYVRGP